jgi:hypothetical protein
MARKTVKVTLRGTKKEIFDAEVLLRCAQDLNRHGYNIHQSLRLVINLKVIRS